MCLKLKFLRLGAGSQDPGVRNQIFMPMTKNKKGFMEVDGRFITVNDMIKCDTAWTEEIHHDFESYIKYDNHRL